MAVKLRRQLSHLVCWISTSISEDEKERFDLGMNEWNDSDDSNDDFLPLKKYRRALVHTSHVVTFYDRSVKERRKHASSNVNSLAALWIAP